jgi:excinuclease UvrABC nuclease subunit
VSATESSADIVTSFGEVEAVSVREDDGELKPAPQLPGVYAFFDKAGVLQYIGLSRKVRTQIQFSACQEQNHNRPTTALQG